MKKELSYDKEDGVSIIINDKYQIYLSDWIIFRLVGEGDIPKYVFEYREKIKKIVNDNKFINLIKII
jgi:hypothetical protein